MFEKEAKERAEEIEANQTLGVYDNDEDLARDEGWNDGYVSGYEEGFQNGADFGYNKAKEELEKAKDIIYQLLMIGKFQFDFCDDETNYYNDCIVKNAEDFIKPKEIKEND